MNYTRTLIIALFIATSACNETDSVKKSLEVSKEITDAHRAIDENLESIEELETSEHETNVDGPYPADEYSLKPTGEFYFLAVHTTGKDSTWLTIKARSGNDILKAYPKLKVYKVRPEWIAKEEWVDIRRVCLKQDMIFDLSAKPKGWLRDHEEKLR